MFGQTIKYIYFHNNTDLPLMISSWVDGSNTLKSAKITPTKKKNETKLPLKIKSSVIFLILFDKI